MTICVYDGKTIYTDSNLMEEDHVIGSVDKIHKLNDGRYIACAGNYQDALAVVDWINENMTRDAEVNQLLVMYGTVPEKSQDPKAGTVQAGFYGFGHKPDIGDNFAAIIVAPDGTWCEVEAKLCPYLSALPVAIGSGALVFKVAYSCDVNTIGCVRKAIEFNAYCGGTIKSVEIVPN